jgi:hypothetical protein
MSFIEEEAMPREGEDGLLQWEQVGGIQSDASASILMWTCANPLLLIYLFAMCLSMALLNGSKEIPATDTRERSRRIKGDAAGDDTEWANGMDRDEDGRMGPKKTGIEER